MAYNIVLLTLAHTHMLLLPISINLHQHWKG